MVSIYIEKCLANEKGSKHYAGKITFGEHGKAVMQELDILRKENGDSNEIMEVVDDSLVFHDLNFFYACAGAVNFSDRAYGEKIVLHIDKSIEDRESLFFDAKKYYGIEEFVERPKFSTVVLDCVQTLVGYRVSGFMNIQEVDALKTKDALSDFLKEYEKHYFIFHDDAIHFSQVDFYLLCNVAAHIMIARNSDSDFYVGDNVLFHDELRRIAADVYFLKENKEND